MARLLQQGLGRRKRVNKAILGADLSGADPFIGTEEPTGINFGIERELNQTGLFVMTDKNYTVWFYYHDTVNQTFYWQEYTTIDVSDEDYEKGVNIPWMDLEAHIQVRAMYFQTSEEDHIVRIVAQDGPIMIDGFPGDSDVTKNTLFALTGPEIAETSLNDDTSIGNEGAAGADGADGAVGPQGPTGPAGPAGADGESIPTISAVFKLTAGAGNFYINGETKPELSLFRGFTYQFDYSNPTMANHPFHIQTTDNNGYYDSTNAVTEGWEDDGNGIITYTLPHDITEPLYYRCASHQNMGGTIQIYNLIPNELIGPQGEQGEAGLPGSAGPAGVQGNDGAVGPTGPAAEGAGGNPVSDVNFTPSTEKLRITLTHDGQGDDQNPEEFLVNIPTGTGPSASGLYSSAYVDANGDGDLPVAQDVGGIKKNTKVEDLNGMTYSELFDAIFFPTQNPTIAPSSLGNTLSSAQVSGGLVKVGTNCTVSLNLSFNRGSITIPGLPSQGPRSGPMTTTAVIYGGTTYPNYNGNGGFQNDPFVISNYIAQLGTNKFTATATSAVGQQPVDSKGDNFGSALGITNYSVDQTFEGVYPFLRGTSTGGWEEFPNLISMSPSGNILLSQAYTHTYSGNGKHKVAIPTAVTKVPVFQQYDWVNDNGAYFASNWVQGANITQNGITYKTYHFDSSGLDADGDQSGTIQYRMRF